MPISRKLILILNLLLIVVIYVTAANLLEDGPFMGFVLSLFHIGVNFMMALICLLIYAIQELSGDNGKFTLSLSITFFLSTILVALLSVPACVFTAYLNTAPISPP